MSWESQRGQLVCSLDIRFGHTLSYCAWRTPSVSVMAVNSVLWAEITQDSLPHETNG
jgi:hypothetical protein